MGEVGAFLKIERAGIPYRDPAERAKNYEEFLIRRSDEELAAAWSAAFRSATTAAPSAT